MMEENAVQNTGENNNEDRYKKSKDVARKVLFSGGLLITIIAGQLAIAGMALGVVLMVYTTGRLIENRKNGSWNPAAHDELKKEYELLDQYVDPARFKDLTVGEQAQIKAALQQGKLFMDAAKEDDIWLLKRDQLHNLFYFLAASALLIGVVSYFLAAIAITITVLVIAALFVATTHDVYKITAGKTNLHQADAERQKVNDVLRGREENSKEIVKPIVPLGWAQLFWRSTSEIPGRGQQMEASVELPERNVPSCANSRARVESIVLPEREASSFWRKALAREEPRDKPVEQLELEQFLISVG